MCFTDYALSGNLLGGDHERDLMLQSMYLNLHLHDEHYLQKNKQKKDRGHCDLIGRKGEGDISPQTLYRKSMQHCNPGETQKAYLK